MDQVTHFVELRGLKGFMFLLAPSLALHGLTDLQQEALLKFVEYADRDGSPCCCHFEETTLELWIHTVLTCSHIFWYVLMFSPQCRVLRFSPRRTVADPCLKHERAASGTILHRLHRFSIACLFSKADFSR